MEAAGQAVERLRPYVAGLAVDWLLDAPDQRHRAVDGTLVFVDISGFTALTERLATKGKAGAEEMSDTLDAVFAELLAVAYAHGAWLVKWGGDAVLLLFEDDDHAARACTAAHEMRATMRRIGRLKTSVGAVTLRMSQGVHTGTFDFFLLGDRHHELVIAGPDATTTAMMEAIADAGEIGLSPATAQLLEPKLLGESKDGAILLGRSPGRVSDLRIRQRDLSGVDLARCLPAPTAAHLLAGGTDGEHRHVAVAFVEFMGTDAMLSGADKLAATDALEQVVTTCQRAAEAHRVTFWETDISKDGGKVMLVSGAPQSAGEDEDRMLAVAREIVDSVTLMPVRIGVNAGRVFAVDFGPHYRRTYSVTGDAINLAARLMAKAAPGEIIVSDYALSRARTSYDTESMEPFLVKGKAKPIVAHKVGRPTGSRDLIRARWPFTGRATELALLTGLIPSTDSAGGAVCVLEGEPGIGKSRLAEEVMGVAATSADVCVLRTACDQYHSGSPYFPLRELFRGLLDVHIDADRHTAGKDLLARLQRDAPELLPWAPLLTAVVDADVPSTPETDALGERFRRARLQQSAVELLRVIIPGPALIFIEDAHLMDEATTDLLGYLSRDVIPDVPWMVLVTRRPTDAGFRAPDVASAHVLELGPLSDDETLLLLAEASDERPLPPHEHATVASRASGNPLFLLELYDATVATGSVDSVPDTVEGVVATQIDRLPPADRRVLRAAAVLGVRFDWADLEAMLGAEGEVVGQDALPRLSAFLEPDENDVRFRHTIARDTAYEGLPFTRRQALHGRAAEVIERRAGNRREAWAGLLSLHYLHGRRPREAWHYSLVAGKRATSVHALAEAAEFYARALSCVRGAEASNRDVAHAAEALGDVCYWLGDLTRADSAYAVARAHVTHGSLHEARLWRQTARVADLGGAHATALRRLTRAMRLLENVRTPGSARLRAEVLADYGLVRHRQGRDRDAVTHLRRAIADAERARATKPLATALDYLALCETTRGWPGAGEHAARALRLWRRLGDRPVDEATTLNLLGFQAYFAGDWARATDFYDEARAAHLRGGNQVDAAVCEANIAEIWSDQGRLEDAEPLLRNALRVWRSADVPSYIAFGRTQLGRLAARAGRYEEAFELLHAARDAYSAAGEHGEILETDARITEAMFLSGAAGAALSAATAALKTASEQPGTVSQLPLLHRVRGLALAALDDRSGALAALEASLSTARERGAQHEVALTLDALIRQQRRWSLAVAPASVKERDALFRQLGMVSIPEPAPLVPSPRVDISDAADVGVGLPELVGTD